MPGILDVTCNPMLYCTVVKIDKRYEGQAQHVILKTFAANQNYNLPASWSIATSTFAICGRSFRRS